MPHRLRSVIMRHRHARNRGQDVLTLVLLLASFTVLPCAGFLLAIEVASVGPTLRQDRSGKFFNPSRSTLFAAPKVNITPDLVRKTAGLAQIQITDDEVNDLVPRMEEFLGFVETMEEVGESSDDTFAALSCGQDFLRDDAAERFSNVAAIMENMPVEEASYLRVPKVGEDEA